VRFGYTRRAGCVDSKPKTKNSSLLKKDYMCMHLPLIPWSIAGVPSSRALPGYPNTALAPECIPVVIGALPVWIQTQQKQNKKCKERKER